MKEVCVSTTLDADKALKEYTSDPEWTFKTGLGGMLAAACMLLAVGDMQHFMLFPISLALAGLLHGYVLRCIRARVKQSDSLLPKWNDWLDLFMSGITWIAVQFALSVVACMLAGSLILSAIYIARSGSYDLWVAELVVFALLLIVSVMHFFSTFLWVNFAVEEKLSAGFAFGKVIDYVSRDPSLFLLVWALSFSAQLTAIVLPAITVIGIFFVPSTYFGAQLLSAGLLAQAWRIAESIKQNEDQGAQPTKTCKKSK